MQHKLMRSRKVIGMLALLATWMGVGTFGCIPAFRGFQPVTVEDLKPKKKSEAPAEILMMNNYYRDRWGQVGSERLAVFWRHHSRIRYNKRDAFQEAKWTLSGHLLDLEVRTVCPDGRVLQMTAADVQQDTRTFNNQRVYNFAAPGLDEGCVVDVMWEMDVPISPNTQNIPPLAILRKFPIQKAHFRYDYDSNIVRRADLINTEHLWIQLAEKKAQSKPDNTEKGSTTQPKSTMAHQKTKVLSMEEKNTHVRLEHDRRQHRIELWLRDLPVGPPDPQDPKATLFAKSLQANLLPVRYKKQPALVVRNVQTLGIGGRKIWLSWRNVDEEFVSPSFVFSETRTPQQRNYQIDEEEELITDALPAVARQVTAKASTDPEKIQAVYHHLRERMFVTKSVDTSSAYRLDKIYALAHGTTYEINMIMVVMLRSLGIRAYLALAAPDNHGYFLENEPKDYFGSFVTYLPDISEGKWRGLSEEAKLARQFLANKGEDYPGGRIVTTGMVLDPSNKGMPFGMLSSSLSSSWVFAIDRRGGRFFKTPEVDGKKNVFHAQVRASVTPDGVIRGVLTISTWGLAAANLRNRFVNTSKHLWINTIVGEWIQKACGQNTQVTLQELPNLELRSLPQPLRYSYQFQAPSCVHHSSRHLLFSLLPTKQLEISNLQSPLRLSPIQFGAPGVSKTDVELTFPIGYQMLSPAPSQATVQGPGISLVMNLASLQNKITYKTEMRWTRRELPPSAYPGIRAFYDKLHDLNKTMVLVGQRR